MAIQSADALLIWEGLPHDLFERGLYAQERTKPVRELFGFSFYPRPLTLVATDITRLKDLLGSPTNFEPYGGPKPCGGFHPDYAIETRSAGDVCYALLCFGCGEVEVHCGATSSKFENAHTWELAAILLSYRTSRPDSRHFQGQLESARQWIAAPPEAASGAPSAP